MSNRTLLSCAFLLLLLVLPLKCADPVPDASSGKAPQSDDMILFPLDDYSIPWRDNLELTLEAPEKYPGKPITKAGPIEGVDGYGTLLYGTVIKQGSKFRMWYLASPRADIIGVRPWTSRRAPGRGSASGEHGISRFPCEVFPCVHRVFDRAGPLSLLALSVRWVWPSASNTSVGAPEFGTFRGSIPGPHVPLSTRRHHPCEWLRMTRRRWWSLAFHRVSLPFTAPRCFVPALYLQSHLEWDRL